MNYLERAITDGHAKFTGDPNNDIQPVSKEALITRSRNVTRPFGRAASSRHRRHYESDAIKTWKN